MEGTFNGSINRTGGGGEGFKGEGEAGGEERKLTWEAYGGGVRGEGLLSVWGLFNTRVVCIISGAGVHWVLSGRGPNYTSERKAANWNHKVSRNALNGLMELQNVESAPMEG